MASQEMIKVVERDSTTIKQNLKKVTVYCSVFKESPHVWDVTSSYICAKPEFQQAWFCFFVNVIPLTLEKPLKGSLILKMCWSTHSSLSDVPTHLVCFPCWKRSSLCSDWAWGVVPSGACNYLGSDHTGSWPTRTWGTDGPNPLTLLLGRSRRTCILWALGCQLLSWDSAGSVFHGFKMEQRGVSKNMAPPFSHWTVL